MGHIVKAQRQVDQTIEFVYIPSRLPDSDAEVIDGNDSTGILDGNQR